jgi:hypothetical protein
MPVVESLLTRLDEKSDRADAAKSSTSANEDEKSSIMVRLFWLVDGLPEKEGSDPSKVLPASVIKATEKLGLEKPRLISQNVNSLAVGAKPVEFSTNVPAVVNGEVTVLSCAGKVTWPGFDDVDLEMNISASGPGVNCQISGSLAAPLDHYTVLGTANSVIGDAQTMHGGEMGMAGEAPGGFARPTFSPRGLPDPNVADPTVVVQKTKYTTARFAFVVQVTEAESYYQEPPEAKTDSMRKNETAETEEDPFGG